MKKVLLADDGYRVPLLRDTYEGSTNDKPIADQTSYPLPEDRELVQDRFVGITLEGVQISNEIVLVYGCSSRMGMRRH